MVFPYTPEVAEAAHALARNILNTNHTRLQTAFWIIGRQIEDSFYGAEIQQEITSFIPGMYTASETHSHLHGFHKMGLITPSPIPGGLPPEAMRTKRYQRVPETEAPLWNVYIALRQTINDPDTKAKIIGGIE